MTSLDSSLQIDDVNAGAESNTRLDQLGIVASVACVVHCMATPILLLFLPVMGSWWSHPAAHWGLAVLVLPLAVWVIWRGYRRHRRRSALVAAGLGVTFIVVGLIMPEIDGPEPLNFNIPAFVSAPANAGSLASATLPDEPAEETHAEDVACSEACCPSLAIDPATDQANITVPPGTLATLLGSVFLVAAHGINLHGCRCSLRPRKTTSTECCGCGEA